MQINLSPSEEAEIRRQATEFGYESPERYLIDLAINRYEDFPKLSDAELRYCAEMCDEGMRDVEAGRVMSVQESLEYSKAALRKRTS